MYSMFFGLRIHRVSENFNCSDKGLKSLEGSPEIIEENFNCSYNSHSFTKEEVRALCEVGGGIYV